VLRPLTPLYNALEIPMVVTPFDARQCFKNSFRSVNTSLQCRFQAMCSSRSCR
jgi:hypothetical protein